MYLYNNFAGSSDNNMLFVTFQFVTIRPILIKIEEDSYVRLWLNEKLGMEFVYFADHLYQVFNISCGAFAR